MRDFHGVYAPVPTPFRGELIAVDGLKAVLGLQGWYGGPCRAPLSTLNGDALDELTESLASAGLL